MEFNGTFNLKLINRIKGETMRQSFRVQMKVIYLGACAAYLEEIVKQLPVLTGASRTAVLWRTQEIVKKAQALNASFAQRLGVDKIGSGISLSPTLHKTPHQYPTPGSTAFRDYWRTQVLESGQDINDWLSDAYIPMLINTGSGNQYAGKYTFNVGINVGSERTRHAPFGHAGNESGGWYIEYYDEGSINTHTDKFDIWGEYGIGPWNLHQDGQRAFNAAFIKFMKVSGVIGLRAVLPGIPIGTPEQYLEQLVH